MEPALFAKIGWSLANSLIYDLLKKGLTGREPEFEEMVNTALTHASGHLNDKFQAETDQSRIRQVMVEFSAESVANPEETPLGFVSAFQSKLFYKDLIHHPNEETKRVYCSQYSQQFCSKLHELLLRSEKFNAVLQSQFMQQNEQSLNDLKENDNNLLLGQSQMQDQLSEVIQLLHSAGRPGVTRALPGLESLSSEITPELDSKIAQGLREIEKLRNSEDFRAGIEKTRELLSIIPTGHTNISNRVVNLFIGFHLKGWEDDWKAGITELEKLDPNLLTPYTPVVHAALLNNLKDWEGGQKVIDSINQSDILSFTREQRDIFWQVKILLLRNQEKDEEAKALLDKIEDKTSDEYKYIQLTVFAKDENENLFSIAEEMLSSKNARLVSGAINYILDRYNLLTHQYGNPFKAASELSSSLEKALSAAHNIAESYREADEYGESIFSAIPAISQLLGKEKKALPLIKKGMEINISSKMFRFNSGLCLFLLGEFELVVTALKDVEKSWLFEQRGMEFYLESLRRTGKIDEINEIYDSIDRLSSSEKDNDRLRGSISEFLIEPKDRIKITEANFKKYPDEEWSLFDYSDNLCRLGDFDSAEKLLIESLDTVKFPLITRSKLAKIYHFHKNDLHKAREQYDHIMSIQAPLSEKIEYLYCLIELELFETALIKVDEFDPSAEEPRLQKYKGYALWKMGEVKPAFNVLKSVVRASSDDIELLFNYAIICWKNNKLEEMAWAYKTYLEKKFDDWETRINYSKLLLSLDRNIEAVKQAKTAFEINPESEHTHYNFINIHMVATKRLPDDKFINSEELNSLHSDLLNNFNGRFPESNLLTPMTLKTNPDGTIDLSEIKEILQQQDEHRQTVFDYYWNQGFPISFMMAAMKRNSHEIWSQLVGSGFKKGMRIGNFDSISAESQLDTINSSEKGLLIDVFGLYALASANSLEILELLPKVFVGTNTLEELNRAIQMLAPSEDGLITMGVQDGQLVKEELSKEQVEGVKKYLMDILQFCNEKLEVVADSKDSKKDLDPRLKGVIESSYEELCKLCLHEKYGLIAGDWNFGGMVHGFGASITSLQSVLMYLQRTKKIKPDKYNKIITEFLLCNYRGIAYLPANIAYFFQAEENPVKRKVLFERILRGNDSMTEEKRITFVADLFVIGIQSFSADSDLKGKLVEFLKSISASYRRLFGIFVFGQNFPTKEIADLIQQTFDQLLIMDENNVQIDSTTAKRHLADAYKSTLQSEYQQFHDSLGLPEDKKDE